VSDRCRERKGVVKVLAKMLGEKEGEAKSVRVLERGAER